METTLSESDSSDAEEIEEMNRYTFIVHRWCTRPARLITAITVIYLVIIAIRGTIRYNTRTTHTEKVDQTENDKANQEDPTSLPSNQNQDNQANNQHVIEQLAPVTITGDMDGRFAECCARKQLNNGFSRLCKYRISPTMFKMKFMFGGYKYENLYVLFGCASHGHNSTSCCQRDTRIPEVCHGMCSGNDSFKLDYSLLACLDSFGIILNCHASSSLKH